MAPVSVSLRCPGRPPGGRGAPNYRTNVLSWNHATHFGVMASESRGNRPAHLDRRPDEDRRDAFRREPSDPRPPPGGPRGEQPVITQGPGASPGTRRGRARAGHRPGRLPGERADGRRNRTPSLLGATGSFHVRLVEGVTTIDRWRAWSLPGSSHSLPGARRLPLRHRHDRRSTRPIR